MSHLKRYQEKLRDPRWQRRRLEVFEKAEFKCEWCGNSKRTLHVHHLVYRHGAEPWHYSDLELVCVCEDCHGEEHGFAPDDSLTAEVTSSPISTKRPDLESEDEAERGLLGLILITSQNEAAAIGAAVDRSWLRRGTPARDMFRRFVESDGAALDKLATGDGEEKALKSIRDYADRFHKHENRDGRHAIARSCISWLRQTVLKPQLAAINNQFSSLENDSSGAQAIELLRRRSELQRQLIAPIIIRS